MEGPIVFDRAAEFYDRTRALSPSAMASVIELLSGELGGRGRCLEVGVGTGRMALPLHHLGVPMAGVDLSRPMLERLVANAGGTAPFPLAVADATALPVRTSGVAAGLLCHVLHLIPAWRGVLDELVRVIEPGGVLLIDPGGIEQRPDELERVFREAAGIVIRDVGLGSIADLDDALQRHGATLRTLPPVDETRVSTPRQRLEAWEDNTYSFTWRLSDEVRTRAVATAREWAETHLVDLNEPRHKVVQISWRAYDLA